MSKHKWHPFDPQKGYRQLRPKERKYVLVLRVSEEEGIPDAVAVGYRRDSGGCKRYPFFVVPGLGGKVIAWCDCLPDGWTWPAEQLAVKESQ